MPTVNVHQAKTQLSRLLAVAAAGGEVVIARDGHPVARLVPVGTAPRRRKPGVLRGRIRVAAGFDDPLPEDVLASFDGRP